MMSELRRLWWVAAGIVLLAAWLVSAFWGAEYRDELVVDPENRRLGVERMHIAQRWLERRGHQVQTLKHLQQLDELPAHNQLLIIPDAIGRQNRLEARQLQQWLLNGGQLIAEAPIRRSTRETAFDLNSFDVSSCSDCWTDEDAGLDPKASASIWQTLQLRQRTVSTPDDQALELWSSQALSVGRPSPKLELWTGPEDRPMLARYAFGAGHITLLADIGWLANERMIEPDHARLLLALIEPNTAGILIQHYSVPGGLLGWLWRQAPPLWIATLLVIALWLWSRLPRFGPILPDPDQASAQMRTHLLATARFDWQKNQARKLLAALDEELNTRAQRRYPDWHRLEIGQRTAHLAKRCSELSPEQIAHHLRLRQTSQADQLIDHLNRHRKLLRAL